MEESLKNRIRDKIKFLRGELFELIEKSLANCLKVADRLAITSKKLDWLEYYQQQDKIAAEIRRINYEILLLKGVLEGKIEFDGTDYNLFKFQLGMGAIRTQIAKLDNKKLEFEIKANQQVLLLKLLK